MNGSRSRVLVSGALSKNERVAGIFVILGMVLALTAVLMIWRTPALGDGSR